jgi:hypothetical protein
MSKAYEHGARTLWIANVGDVKPAEIGTEYFLQLAWDANRSPGEFLVEWATREFGEQNACEIAAVMTEYYRLNFQRKPEHLQWWLPKESPRPSGYSQFEVAQRLNAFTAIRKRADRLYAAMPSDRRDAFFELVAYPVRGATLANLRYFFGEQPQLHPQALAADAELTEQTRLYNQDIASGKWRNILSLEPADTEWSSMRISHWSVPKFANSPPADRFTRRIDAGAFTAKTDQPQARWQIVPGLGHSGSAVIISPSIAASIPLAQAATSSPHVDYDIGVAEPGEIKVSVQLMPTRPIHAGHGLRLGLGLDDQAPIEIEVNSPDDSPEWVQAVLNGSVNGRAQFSNVAAGPHTLKVYMIDAGVALDRIAVESPMRPAN